MASPHYARDAVARSWRWSCHRATIPRHRGTGPEAYLFSTSQGTRREDARLPAVQNGAVLEAGGSIPEGLRDRDAKRIRSHYLPLPTERLPGFCTPLRYNAKPHSILSMPRLCAFADLSRSPSGRDPPAVAHSIAAGGSCVMRARSASNPQVRRAEGPPTTLPCR